MLLANKKFILISCIALLSGCSEQLTDAYLLQHPAALKREASTCLLHQHSKEYCARVARDLTVHMTLLHEAEANPLEFGRRIMDVENAYARAKESFETAENALNQLKTAHASAESIKTAEDKVNTAKTVYDYQEQEMKTLLAVIGVNGPE